MTKGRTFVALAVVTVVAVALAVVAQRRDEAPPRAGELVFPGLLERVNEARTITGMAGGETFNVELEDGRWVVREKGGYRADPDKVHLLVVGAAGLRRIEPKTSNPDLYHRLGLEDPATPGGQSVRYVLKDGAGAILADLLVGSRRPAKTTLEDSEIYIRLGDDPQSWLVQGKLPQERDALEWIEEKIVAVDEARIREVESLHPDGSRILIRKEMPGDVDYALVGKPDDRDIDGQWKLNDMGRAFSSFELEDVLADWPAGGEAGSDGPRVLMRTYDGLVVELGTRKVGEKTYGNFSARFDESLLAAAEAVRDAATDDDREAVAKLLDRDAVQAEAQRLGTRWEGWVFELPDYRVGYLSKRLEDLLAAPQPAAGSGVDDGGSQIATPPGAS
jgi:hypothetical protein